MTPQTKSSTMLDAGGYWHLKGEDTMQLLFAYGHSIAGQTENYAYLGLYWTWGKDDKSGTDQDKNEDKDKDKKAMLDKAMYSGHHLQHGF